MATTENRGPYQFRVKVRRKGHRPLSKTFNNRKDAEAWGRAMEAEMDRGSFIPADTAQRTTVTEALERYRDEVFPRLAQGGRPELSRLNRLIEAFDKLSLAALDTVHVAQYRDRRLYHDGASAQTVKHEIGLLNRVLKQCSIDWGIHLPRGLVTALVRKPTVPPGRKRRLLPGEEEILLAAARKSKSRDIEPIIIIALETAARRGEIAAMRWEHIDFEKSTWFIPITKNGESREVPLYKRAIETLKRLPRRIDGFVWTLRRPDGITQAFDRICKSYQKENEGRLLRGLRFHDLRHEATSRLFEKGHNEMEAGHVTGHKDSQMLRRYTHLRAEDLVKKFD